MTGFSKVLQTNRQTDKGQAAILATEAVGVGGTVLCVFLALRAPAGGIRPGWD